MIWALGCLAACVGLSLVAPRLGPSLHPALATRLLTGVSVVSAAGALWVLVLAASTEVAQVPVVAHAEDWSPQLIAAADPVPRWIAFGCIAAFMWAVVAGGRAVLSQMSGLARLNRTLGAIPPAGRLTVVDDPRGIAFATPAAGGRIVVSTGMLRALRGDERQALLAHESAHVQHRHYWWSAAAQVAATTCPILRPTAHAVAASAERWADEDAAGCVGDRSVMARALARAALHTASAPAPSGALPAVHSGVLGRVEAMLQPPPARRVAPAWALIALLAVGLLTAWLAGVRTDAIFDQAWSHPPASTTTD